MALHVVWLHNQTSTSLEINFSQFSMDNHCNHQYTQQGNVIAFRQITGWASRIYNKNIDEHLHLSINVSLDLLRLQFFLFVWISISLG